MAESEQMMTICIFRWTIPLVRKQLEQVYLVQDI